MDVPERSPAGTRVNQSLKRVVFLAVSTHKLTFFVLFAVSVFSVFSNNDLSLLKHVFFGLNLFVNLSDFHYFFTKFEDLLFLQRQSFGEASQHEVR